MKKITSLLLFVLLLVYVTCAFAVGKATVTQETFYVAPYYNGSFEGIIFGEITNTGDRAVAIDNGIFELFDVDGEAVGSGRIYSFYPEIILPEDNAFFKVSHNVESATNSTDIDDYSVTVVGKSTKENSVIALAATCSFEEYNDYKNTRNTKLFATIENNTGELVSGPEVVWAVYDTDEKLIYVDNTSASSIGLYPGSKIQLSTQIDTDIQVIMNTNGVEIGSVKVIAWVD